MRILIADDSGVVRRGIIAILSSESGMEVCGEAKDGSETLLKAPELLPDLILLDVSMPDMNGLDVTRRLRREVPHTRILLISQHDPIQLLPRALEAGADGCVDKSHLATDLLPRIKTIDFAAPCR